MAVEDELEKARNTIMSLYGPDFFAQEWDIVRREGYWAYAYIPRSSPSKVSSILIFAKRRYFIKLRSTYTDTPALRDISNDLLHEMQQIIKRDAVLEGGEDDPV